MGMCPTDWLRNMLRQTNREGFCTQSMPCPVAFLQRPHTLPSLYVIICMYPQLIFAKKFTIIAREPASHAKIRVAKELCTLKINKGEILQVIPSPEIGSLGVRTLRLLRPISVMQVHTCEPSVTMKATRIISWESCRTASAFSKTLYEACGRYSTRYSNTTNTSARNHL